MKLWVAICFAVVVVALAQESVVLDETTDLLQESALVDAGAKTQAKVSNLNAAKATTKEGAKVKAKATVRIGTHDLDAEAVSAAKAQLSKITIKLGARHPIFLGEAAGIADFTQNDARYVKGGYAKLKKILIKIDEFEDELYVEKQDAVNEREKKYQECQKADEQFEDDGKTRDELISNKKQKQKGQQTKILEFKGNIATDLTTETGVSQTLKSQTDEVSSEYHAYWQETEERHQVRNVLMQALWLVCTGFATFRHTEYCTNIRQQPDFDEPNDKGKSEFDCQASDAAPKCKEIQEHSMNFGQTMQPVWEQQKIADQSNVNQFDGDTDMEKGFVNNRAPWGVDPEGMEDRGSNEGDSEELGESNKAKTTDMSSAEMSSRLQFLLDSSSVPERISVPITALIQAFDSDDAAVQGGLVEALVKMDTEEGESQSNSDYMWYSFMINRRQTMNTEVGQEQARKRHALGEFEDIEQIIEDMDKERAEEVLEIESDKTDLQTYKDGGKDCDAQIIELEALIEAVNEELVNIKRLNSLLRYLVVGDEAKCENKIECDNQERGSCTWRTRGENPGSGPNTESEECETETGEDIPCDYSESYPDDRYTPAKRAEKIKEDPHKNDDVFCACEYGFYDKSGSGRDCKGNSCPGFGRIRYPGNAHLPLSFQGHPLFVDEDFRKPGAGKWTSYRPDAVCSGIRLTQHGTCSDEGKCVTCWLDKTATTTKCMDYPTDDPQGCAANVTPDNVETMTGVYAVPFAVTQSMPYNGPKSKCEMWYVPGSWDFVEERTKWTLESDPNACESHGDIIYNFMHQSTGKCSCRDVNGDESYYGEACQLKKCMQGSGIFYQADSPVVCNGRGVCKTDTGTCVCDTYSTGSYCEEKRCTGYEKDDPDTECGNGSGTCNILTGRCKCKGMSCGLEDQPECPGSCIYHDCEANCGGQNTDGATQTGVCDRFSGLCSCSPTDVYNGPSCVSPQRGARDQLEGKLNMIWTSSMDKWGWSLCPEGYLLVGMKTDAAQTRDALYNLDRGICQQPWEKNALIDKAVEEHRCYHENWWKKFDTRGGKFCRRNYFVAGLFRSHCNSLYCIEMAKCCSVKRSLWTNCKWTSAKDWINQGLIAQTGFIVGFFRDATHTLAGITHLRECVPIWYGQLYRMKTRFDNS